MQYKSYIVYMPKPASLVKRREFTIDSKGKRRTLYEGFFGGEKSKSKGANTWLNFLRDNKGKGKSRTELSAMYRRKK